MQRKGRDHRFMSRPDRCDDHPLLWLLRLPRPLPPQHAGPGWPRSGLLTKRGQRQRGLRRPLHGRRRAPRKAPAPLPQPYHSPGASCRTSLGRREHSRLQYHPPPERRARSQRARALRHVVLADRTVAVLCQPGVDALPVVAVEAREEPQLVAACKVLETHHALLLLCRSGAATTTGGAAAVRQRGAHSVDDALVDALWRALGGAQELQRVPWSPRWPRRDPAIRGCQRDPVGPRGHCVRLLTLSLSLLRSP